MARAWIWSIWMGKVHGITRLGRKASIRVGSLARSPDKNSTGTCSLVLAQPSLYLRRALRSLFISSRITLLCTFSLDWWLPGGPWRSVSEKEDSRPNHLH